MTISLFSFSCSQWSLRPTWPSSVTTWKTSCGGATTSRRRASGSGWSSAVWKGLYPLLTEYGCSFQPACSCEHSTFVIKWLLQLKLTHLCRLLPAAQLRTCGSIHQPFRLTFPSPLIPLTITCWVWWPLLDKMSPNLLLMRESHSATPKSLWCNRNVRIGWWQPSAAVLLQKSSSGCCVTTDFSLTRLSGLPYG